MPARRAMSSVEAPSKPRSANSIMAASSTSSRLAAAVDLVVVVLIAAMLVMTHKSVKPAGTEIRVSPMSGNALATGLAVAAGLAGSIQVALMSRLGERIGVLGALAFSTALTAVIALLILFAARGSLGAFSRAVH